MNTKKFPRTLSSPIIFVTIALVLLVISYWGGLENLVFRWLQREEYSHGFFIPAISLYLLWDRREALVTSVGSPSIFGIFAILVAILLLIVGELSAIFLLLHLGFILCLFGLVLVFGGISLLRVCFLPIAFLAFAIPTPYFIDAQLSWGLQLISSTLGVDIIRLLGVSVYLEGNVIDLGHYKLQVVEACSGLRYLYPLLSLGFLASYFFSAPLWKRVLIFVSVVPITVFMNSFRIAIIGVLVNMWGNEMAEGFLHFFEGWIIFMSCAVLLLLEVWLLDRVGNQRSFGNLLALPEVQPARPSGTKRGGIALLALSIAIFGLTSIGVYSMDERQELVPSRKELSAFPLEMDEGEWIARESYLEPEIEDALAMDDYLLADYKRSSGEQVNFYIAYYASQRKGNSPHSPRVCIPGGGWAITHLSEIQYAASDEDTFPIIRAELEIDSQRLLVYYWFEQRGRRIANEYWTKWYLLVDSLLTNRTDGALVRVTTEIYPNESMAAADKRIQEFIATAIQPLPEYIPH